MAGLSKGVPPPTEIKLHQKSDGHDTGIYSWDLLYDYGTRRDEMWRHYLKRMQEAGASRELAPRKA
jgi:DUF971 family protein